MYMNHDDLYDIRDEFYGPDYDEYQYEDDYEDEVYYEDYDSEDVERYYYDE